MPTYRLLFTGQLKGAIGISYLCRVTVEAEDEESAKLKAYDTHDHCHGIRVRRLPDERSSEDDNS